MSYNGSGTFTRAHNWTDDRNDGIKISADRMDAEDDGFADGLTNAICKDGQSTTTARVPFAVGIGVNDGSAGTPSITFNSDTDLGLYRKTTNTVAATAGAAEIFNWDADGITLASGKVLSLPNTGPVEFGTGGELVGTRQSLADDASYALPGSQGFLFIMELVNGTSGIFVLTAGLNTVQEIYDPSNAYVVADTDGNNCIFHNGTSYVVKNRGGATRVYQIFYLGTQ